MRRVAIFPRMTEMEAADERVEIIRQLIGCYRDISEAKELWIDVRFTLESGYARSN
jgi:hypothetical protein